jgi:Protein of unknown function (DUF3592)
MRRPFYSIEPTLSNILIAAFMCSIAFLGDVFLIRSWIAQSKTQHFQQASGVIISVKALRSSADPINDRLHVQYKYRVNGKDFISGRINCSMDFTVKSMDAYARQYKNGASIVVYYDPDEPEKAVLERGLTIRRMTSPFTIVLGTASLVVFSILVYLIQSRIRTAKRQFSK